MMYSIVWQENQIGQLNTVIWSIIRLQPWYIVDNEFLHLVHTFKLFRSSR